MALRGPDLVLVVSEHFCFEGRGEVGGDVRGEGYFAEYGAGADVVEVYAGEAETAGEFPGAAYHVLQGFGARHFLLAGHVGGPGDGVPVEVVDVIVGEVAVDASAGVEEY